MSASKDTKSQIYNDLESEVNSFPNGSNNGLVSGDVYEVLNFDENNDDDNIYEDLDSLDSKNTISPKAVSPDLPALPENGSESKNDATKTFTIDSFYLKKLDSIIQEIRFGIGKIYYPSRHTTLEQR